MAVNDNSDYELPRTNILELIPEVYRSDTNNSVIENTFNRFLSKQETKRVSGIIGSPDPSGITGQLVEPTVARQAFQLQPMLYTKIGTINHLFTYNDVLNEATRLGIDTDRLPVWGNALEFNWAPPIDIDKLVHYLDYYWYDPSNPSSTPQYLTIKNLSNTADALVTVYQQTLNTTGNTMTVDSLAPKMIVLVNDFTTVFAKGFVFYTTSTANADFTDRWWQVTDSTFDATTGLTTVSVSNSFTDYLDVSDIVIDLSAYLSFLEDQRDFLEQILAAPSGTWDVGQTGNVVWNTLFVNSISYVSSTEWAYYNGVPVVDSLWIDTTNDQLKQYDGTTWNVVANSFSIISSINTEQFDYLPGTDYYINSWVSQNKWLHKSVVPNFSVSKQAQLPIIEYNPSTELNEWTYTKTTWEYRKNNVASFASTTSQPTLLELMPITIDSYITSTTLSIPSSFGDLTDIFVPGFVAYITDGSVTEQVTVKYSLFKDLSGTDHRYQTVVELTVAPLLGTATSFGPTVTSLGDIWVNYNEHWLFVETLDPVPVDQQAINPFIDDYYSSTLSPYAQKFVVATPTTTFNLDTILTTTALVGADECRVYYNDVRQIGNYTEITSGGYVTGVIFASPLTSGTVRIEVGPATVGDIGWDAVPVRTVVDEAAWLLSPVPVTKVLTKYRKTDQIKNNTVQYPLFDVFDVKGNSLNTISYLFGFNEDSSYPVNQYIQKRIVQTSTKEYQFQQFLLEGDNGKLYTYRDYSLIDAKKYWIAPTDEVLIWNNKAWTDKLFLTGYYVKPVWSGSNPGNPTQGIAGTLWYNTAYEKLFTQLNVLITDYVHNTNTFSFSDDYTSVIAVGDQIFVDNVVFPLTISTITYDSGTNKTTITTAETCLGVLAGSSYIGWRSVSEDLIFRTTIDPTIQTIWKKGLNDENYVPAYVDVNKQAVTIGSTSGTWEIPAQLYYNNSHENREYVTYTQLLSHYNTIIDAQVPLPGFIGTTRQLFNLNFDVNYGLGGTIKEFNDSYDTFLSSMFIDSVTPLSLIDFAHDQYENGITTIRELYRKNIVSYLTDTTITGITNYKTDIINGVISLYEENDALGVTYGDSSAFDPSTSLGVYGWIITLPFMNLVTKIKPQYYQDTVLGINDILHHDGHRSHIELKQSFVSNLTYQILNTANATTTTLGRTSTTIPPQTRSDFLTAYGTTSIVGGVYWYNTSTSVLYRSLISIVSSTTPLDSVEYAYWYDQSTNILKQRVGTSWVAVTGIVDDISGAWTIIDLNTLLAETILEVETRLYNVAPTYTGSLAFDFDSLKTELTLYDSLEELEFNDYVHKHNILSPYSTLLTYSQSDAFTWNYKYSTITYPSSFNAGTESGGIWQDLYEKIYNTPYPHLEPWRLQTYSSKPDWWDTEYADSTGARRWTFTYGAGLSGIGTWGTGMWENIRTGVVPVGKTMPDGITISDGNPSTEVPTYAFFSVNVENSAVDGIDPDELFPPYWNYSNVYGGTYTGPNRSLIGNLISVISPNLDFVFGDSGSTEWEWKSSSQYLYDQLKVAFLMQPIRFLHYAFGNDFIEVGGLQIDGTTEQVFAHQNTIWHGDITNVSEVYKSPGLNQWYVNYNRYSGFDTGTSDFRKMWTEWTAPLSYQFSSFIDKSSFFITNSVFDVSDQDYNILIKKSPGISDYWTDALKVSVLYAPPIRLAYNTESEWKLQVNTSAPIGRKVELYGVQRYKFGIDASTDLCTLYRYQVVGVDTTNNIFYVDGDQTDVFSTGMQFVVSASTGNDATWTVSSVVYDALTKRTAIKVTTAITNPTADGLIVADYRQFSWSTGDTVQVSATKMLPIPLEVDTNYYIIKYSNSTFKLAETYDLAIAGIAIDMTSVGQGDLYVGQVSSTFTALDGQTVSSEWKQFAVDKNYTETMFLPQTISGVQNVVDYINGYSAFAEDQGFIFNYQGLQKDPVTGSVDNWQYETERFIDWAYGVQKTKFAGRDIFAVTADHTTSNLSFTNYLPVWGTGTQIKFSVTGGSLPSPLLTTSSYFIIRDASNASLFKVALTKTAAKAGQYITLLDNGSGSISVSEFVQQDALPTFEINPFRNNIWFSHPQGIVSDVIQGPYKDIVNNQTIYDQYGRLIKLKDINIFRSDKQTNIFVHDEIPNDVVTSILSTADPYNYIHMGGLHLFLDGYEHVVLFEDYSTDNYLIYDSFIGLNTPRFDVQFDRQINFTLRPNIGGYFLLDEELNRNFEASTVDLQKAYSTHTTAETNTFTENARNLLGYDGPKTYMSDLNINPKSQFVFWRGMIQNKGSNNSIKAFANSRSFVDASLDEFWAYKVAEFGDYKEVSYPELNLFVKDSATNELRLQFISNGEAIDNNFEGVSLATTDRWYEFPNQEDILNRLDPLYFEANVTLIDSSPTYLYEGGSTPPGSAGSYHTYYVSSVSFDDVIITYYNTSTYTIDVLQRGVDYDIIHSQMVRFLTLSDNGETGLDPTALTDVKIYGLTSANPDLTPNKIIDYKSGVVVSELPIWDPARGLHYYVAINQVDLQSNTDFATYSNSLFTSSPDTNWNFHNVGTTWMDTSTIGYYPYYDERIYPDIGDRVLLWGQQADWSTLNVYQWTESDVPPDQWNALAAQQEGDTTIPENQRKTGVVREVVVKNVSDTWDVISFKPLRLYIKIQTSSTVDVSSLKVAENDYVDVYYNGAYAESCIVNSSLDITIALSNYTIGYIDIVRRPPSTSQIYNPVSTLTNAGTWDASTNTPTITSSVGTTGDYYVVSNAGTTTIDSTSSWAIGDWIVFDGTSWFKVTNGQYYAYDTPHTEVIYYDTNTLKEYTMYYFWVGDKKARQNRNGVLDTLSINEVNADLTNIPISYVFYQNLKLFNYKGTWNASTNSPTLTSGVGTDGDYYKVATAGTTTIDGVNSWSEGDIIFFNGSTWNIITFADQQKGVSPPNRYTQLIARGLSGLVGDDDRYVIRFTRDFALRDSLDDRLDLSTKHTEWALIREGQTYNVPSSLWDKITESLIGTTLDGTTTVPTVDRVLYDEQNSTDTQYGLGDGQAFVNKDLALATILSDLQNPANDFYPIDINGFFANHSFDTSTNIISAMSTIYDTFSYKDVNRIFFAVLNDAFSTKSKYKEIFKTSMVSLYAVKTLTTG